MEPMQSIEVTGDNVEEAIAAGLSQLGVGPGDVIVEVLEEPTRGVFGIGAKPAKVRLRLLRPAAPPPPAKAEPVSPKPEAKKPAPAQANNIDDGDDDEDDDDSSISAAEEVSEDEIGDDGRIGREVLGELLEKMGLEVRVVIKRSGPSRPGEEAPWLLDVQGNDLSGLIGRRGDTLSSLQYITRLISSRRLQRRANIIVDVAGYKSKRSERLRQLATRMANQAIKQGRTVTLEPMPPNERRIIHLELRGRNDVITKSVGEGSSRKVTIVPK
ncbi:MAG: RNA-binding cell elongation regulator Jag/EloR [Aggregatilineales bacterium]